ncbi:hypothetical protein PVAND_016122 [Polypedilum vanderplanki]|uniref:Uncharacterized protein n=1 Tax=Polypedilum vanderplanki TaxID=319348 RepID=A0A9J6BE70_POLVA|nr:hypothetical protein PVAND_016122 [Polypedilum vanderplanki]
MHEKSKVQKNKIKISKNQNQLINSQEIPNEVKDKMIKKMTEMLAKSHIELVDQQVENYKLKKLLEIKEKENQMLKNFLTESSEKKYFKKENFNARKKRKIEESDEDFEM